MGIFNFIKKKRPLEEREDFEKDLRSISDFFAELERDVKDLKEIGIKVKKIRAKERSEVDYKKQIKLLHDEVNAWDKFLERFVMLDRDTDIAGERVKKISGILKEEAVKMKLDPDTIQMVKRKDEWAFDW